jgi:hypothetical protein
MITKSEGPTGYAGARTDTIWDTILPGWDTTLTTWDTKRDTILTRWDTILPRWDIKWDTILPKWDTKGHHSPSGSHVDPRDDLRQEHSFRLHIFTCQHPTHLGEAALELFR